MQIDPEEFRRHYDSLSDEALLEVDRDELVEVAQQCYDEELALRGIALDAPASETALTQEPAGSHEWVVAAEFSSVEEANLAHAMLDTASIPVRLEAKGTSSWTGFGGMRLLVPAADLEEAQVIIDSPISDEELTAQAEAESPPDSDEEA